MGRTNPVLLFIVLAGWILGFTGIGTGVKPLLAAGSLLTGIAFTAAMVRCHRVGVIRTNMGPLRRAENPVGFWAMSLFWWTLIGLWTLAGVLRGLAG